jgi:hypothetical protein
MTENTTKLLALVDQFKSLQRIDFDDREHRVFLKDLILAVKAAAPEIRKMVNPMSMFTIQPDPDSPFQQEYRVALQRVRKAAALAKVHPAGKTPRTAKRSAKAAASGQPPEPVSNPV